ncbi:DUF1819 family protein [Paratractidigestivibacter faecalis]|uniref:DUF1819 family protein n=1 Tax=Paratractidigestivibacter faecalis TaxID=2292441 RepID=UPI00388EB36E
MAQNSRTVRGGALTREQFLPHEMRVVADLRLQGNDDEKIVSLVREGNLFQYPTMTMVANRARVCVQRLNALVPDEHELARRGVTLVDAAAAADELVRLIAQGMPQQASQAILYSMMCRYDLVREFILDEVGERLHSLDYTLADSDLNAFITRFQVRYPDAAKWSDATLVRLRATLRQCLTQSGLRESQRSEAIQPLLLDPEVEGAILALGDSLAVSALTGQEVLR